MRWVDGIEVLVRKHIQRIIIGVKFQTKVELHHMVLVFPP
jgi:hypothetical protein